jgi:hypothetical protein
MNKAALSVQVDRAAFCVAKYKQLTDMQAQNIAPDPFA